jgi:hypothetical protein
MSTAQSFEINFNKFNVHTVSDVAEISQNNNNNNNKVYQCADSKSRGPIAKRAQNK